MTKTKLILSTLAVSTMMIAFTNPLRVSADQQSPSLKVSQDSKDGDKQSVGLDTNEGSSRDMSPDELSQLTKYIQVVNNQYVLSIPAEAHIDQSSITFMQKSISAANSTIKSMKISLDPTTKTGVISSPDISTSNFAVSTALEAHQVIYQWFGVTHLFRSNEAINIFTDTLSEAAVVTAAAGATGLEPEAILTAVGSAGSGVYSADLSAMSSSIDGFNQAHSGEKVGVNIMFGLTWHNFTFTD